MPRFTPDFLDELKSRLKPSGVIGRYVKLRKQGNEWAGLSPFTKEKTPSFFVNDQKGFYHCFSSGKHGDIIGFLVETQGLTFPEAVARLAEEAGLSLPADEPGEAVRMQRRKGLAEASAAAAAFFQQTLKASEGRPGADYLKSRGLSAEQIATFRLGFAPASRVALKEHLLFKGYTEDVLIEAGLLIKPDDGGPAYDRFRGRVMFPILSANGETIAFGGRALEKDAKPKYLNSPETPLFHQGDVLYNFGQARKAAAESGEALIVCEGYMDVIALHGAGFKTAVAPLGTALGEAQLQLLWRHCDEPFMCLDGDRAGVAAAYRSIDRALPLLKPGKSLAFVFLPDNQDPDDLIRARGAEAFRTLLKSSAPLAAVLWRRETEARPLDTPERRAALRAHLRELVKGVADRDVRAAYGEEFARRLAEAFPREVLAARRPATGQGGRANPSRRAGRKPFEPAYADTLNAARPTAALKARARPTDFAREAILLLALVRHPGLFERCEAEVTALHLQTPALQTLLDLAVAAILTDPALDSETLNRHLHRTEAAETLERILSDETLNTQSFLRPAAELDEVERGWKDALRLSQYARLAQADVAESAAASLTLGDSQWKAAVKHREEQALSGERNDSREDGVSPQEFASSLERLKENIDRKTRRQG
jgi:DNA primase